MITLIDLVNRALIPVFNLICRPFQNAAPIWTVTVISLITGVAMVWIFGKVSDQRTIKGLRENIRGNLIGVRLFQADIGVVLRLQRHILRDTFRYMRYALVPMVILLVPTVLIITQLQLRFAARPLEPGEQALVKAYVRDATLLDAEVELEVRNGVRVETQGVRIPSTREVAWRIRADFSGEHQITVRIGNHNVQTRVIAGDQWGAVPQRRTGRGIWDTLLYPGEPPIPGSHAIEAVEITYPALELSVFGWSVDWLVAFLVLSLAFGFAFKNILGVEI